METVIWTCNVLITMGRSRLPTVVIAILAVLVILITPTVQAGEHGASYLVEDVYTEEQVTTNRDVLLEGETVVEAWFNFTVLEDKIQSRSDSFLFAVTNMDDATLTQNLPGTTDTQGSLDVPIHFTLEGSPRWRVSVTCTDAGDTMGPLGQTVIDEDAGNAWSLQVEYVYWIDEGENGGNGGNGGGSGGDGEEMTLVTIMELDLLAVALGSLLVAFLAAGVALSGEGRLKLPLIISAVLALDAFVLLPVALVVNLELNDTILAMPPFGPGWLGNLALILLVVWVVPFLVARKRVMGSDEVRDLIGRLTARRLADRVRGRAERLPPDPLPVRILAALMVALGIASVVVIAMMVLGGA
jgi:hypothetical protein